MFEQVEAVRFDRFMSNGKTQPMLLACERHDEAEVEVVAKFSLKCSIGGLIREAMAAMFAKDILLPVPEPFLVKISAEFVASIQNAPAVKIFKESSEFGFGSCRLPNGFAPWIAPDGRMETQLDKEALEIMALDSWLTNPDRRVSNPNLLRTCLRS